jgi:hypothetical protein
MEPNGEIQELHTDRNRLWSWVDVGDRLAACEYRQNPAQSFRNGNLVELDVVGVAEFSDAHGSRSSRSHTLRAGDSLFECNLLERPALCGPCCDLSKTGKSKVNSPAERRSGRADGFVGDANDDHVSAAPGRGCSRPKGGPRRLLGLRYKPGTLVTE